MVTTYRPSHAAREIPELIVKILRDHELEPGDLITTARNESGASEQSVLNSLWFLLDHGRVEITDRLLLRLRTGDQGHE